MTTQAERLGTTQPTTSQEHIELVERTTAHNYHPLPVVVAEAEGCWVTDVEGKRYLDMLSAYSALNFGHRHPELIAAAKEQLDRVTLTSRAFHNDQMGPFLRDLTELCGMDMALLMNSGAEAVETAIKTARKWGYEVKGVAPDRAKVIVAGGNFHGRTITIVSFSTDEASRRNFGPLTPGFEVVPYGDAAALEAAIDEDTVAFLVEPIQGEAGVVVPPEGYLRRARELCTERGVLLVADEIQIGPRPHGDDVRVRARRRSAPTCSSSARRSPAGSCRCPPSSPTVTCSASSSPDSTAARSVGILSRCAIGRRVVAMLRTGEFQERSAKLGEYLLRRSAGAEPRHRRRGQGPRAVGRDRPRRLGRHRASLGGAAARRKGSWPRTPMSRTLRLAPPLVIEPATSSTGASSASSRCSSAPPRTSGSSER